MLWKCCRHNFRTPPNKKKTFRKYEMTIFHNEMRENEKRNCFIAYLLLATRFLCVYLCSFVNWPYNATNAFYYFWLGKRRTEKVTHSFARHCFYCRPSMFSTCLISTQFNGLTFMHVEISTVFVEISLKNSFAHWTYQEVASVDCLCHWKGIHIRSKFHSFITVSADDSSKPMMNRILNLANRTYSLSVAAQQTRFLFHWLLCRIRRVLGNNAHAPSTICCSTKRQKSEKFVRFYLSRPECSSIFKLIDAPDNDGTVICQSLSAANTFWNVLKIPSAAEQLFLEWKMILVPSKMI